jgi:hypothetical protein
MNHTKLSRTIIAAALLLGPSAVVLAANGPPALAACDDYPHHNIHGANPQQERRGNRGGILINDIDYGELHASIHRSLFVVSDSYNMVEVGWTANNGSHSGPTVFREYVNRGSDSGPLYDSKALAHGDYYNFRVQDGDNNTIFTYYVDSDDIGQSGNMNFSRGTLLTNSERRNPCDTWYAHFKNLKQCNNANPCDWTAYSDLSCYFFPPGSDNYKFDEISVQEHYVRTGGGITC